MAGGTILQTKLNISLPSQVSVARPNLIRTLETGVLSGHPLILVSAPAGFGKTTLVAAWVRRVQPQSSSESETRVAWLTLDRKDNDPARFGNYLLAGLILTQAQDSRVGWQGTANAPLEPIFTALSNQLIDNPGKTLIVLDDYHFITNPAIHDPLSYFIENLPHGATVVIISRADPSFPLARLRARGQLTEVRAADLRFTLEESAAFLNQAMGIDLTEEQLATLVSRTEGWAAGLQMAALTMQGTNDLDGFLAAFSGSHRYILDYLMEEVFAQQSETRQDFLLRTALLERMNGLLCEAVTGQARGQEMLEALEAANLFIVPQDDVRGWYRYHHLFAN